MGEYQRIVDNHEWFNDRIGYMLEAFILSGELPKSRGEEMAIRRFIAFARQETLDSLNCKRGREATSYLQRAEAERKSAEGT